MADVLFFPSLYEGFGLTPLEALAVGTRVISSNTSAMPEVLGSCAEYIDPTVVDEAVAALWKVLFEVEDSQGERQRRIAHARSFTWDRTGELTRDAYREYSKTQRLGESLRRSAP
jgi:glycosyltransferase involved in cell wall biosynthesis